MRVKSPSQVRGAFINVNIFIGYSTRTSYAPVLFKAKSYVKQKSIRKKMWANGHPAKQ